MPAAGMKSADLKQSSRDKASASHCVTMPALTPNAWDGERLEVRSLERQRFGFGRRKSRAWAFSACRSPKARNHAPPPQPRTPKVFRKWLKLHARVRAALQLLACKSTTSSRANAEPVSYTPETKILHRQGTARFSTGDCSGAIQDFLEASHVPVLHPNPYTPRP